MDGVAGTIRAANQAFAWSPPALSGGPRASGRSLAHVLAAATLHGLALWLILGAAERIAPRVPPPPIVAQIIPPIEQPTPARREVPLKQPTDARTLPKAAVPEPDLTTPDTSSAVVVPAQPAQPSPPPAAEPAGMGTGPTPGPAKPRGFGSISNRIACLEAFRDSYPREARRARLEGSVTIAARISAEGKILHAEVVNAQPRRTFDRAALNVLNSGACRFDTDLDSYAWQAEISYRLDGEAVE